MRSLEIGVTNVALESDVTGMPERQRRLEYDALRTVAIFAIVLLHISTYVVYWKPNPAEIGWVFSDWVFICCHWAVPVFIMLTGAVLSIRDTITFSFRHWARRLIRLGLITLAVSGSFVLISIFVLQDFDRIGFGLAMMGAEPFFHLWYLYLALGLYTASPLLLLIARRFSPTTVYLVMAIVIAVCAFANWPGANPILKLFVGLGLCGYFLVGALLQKLAPPTGWRLALVIVVFLASAIIDAELGVILVPKLGNGGFEYAGAFTNPFVAVMAVCMFNLAGVLPLRMALVKISGATLGVYIIHPLWVLVLAQYNITGHWHGAFIGIPLVAIAVFVLSLMTVLTAKTAISVVRRLIFATSASQKGFV